MSYLSRSMGTFAVAMVTVLTLGLPMAAAAQVNAVKDGWLVMKVHSEFVDEDVLSGSNIDVDVNHGVVTLKGTVTSQAARARAVEVARKNDGVKNVVDQLRIAPSSHTMDKMDHAADKADHKMDKAEDKMAKTADKAGDKMAKTADKAGDKMDHAGDKTENAAKKTGRAIDDGWIKSKIYAQYMADWNTVLNDSNINVDVNNNMVVLKGTVKSAEAKAKAVSIAKATDGVHGVTDNLSVVPK
jgi:osmotically-inducible protein OsmY